MYPRAWRQGRPDTKIPTVRAAHASRMATSPQELRVQVAQVVGRAATKGAMIAARVADSADSLVIAAARGARAGSTRMHHHVARADPAQARASAHRVLMATPAMHRVSPPTMQIRAASIPMATNRAIHGRAVFRRVRQRVRDRAASPAGVQVALAVRAVRAAEGIVEETAAHKVAIAESGIGNRVATSPTSS
jgi:hypothetical protein